MLSPYRVLEISSDATQMCGHLFAEMGADVVVVEPPGGSSVRRRPPFAGGVAGPERGLWWRAYNRGKRSVTLDLDEAGGRRELERLVAGAHFLIEGEAPGWLAARGLGYDRLAAINPGIIVASITWFGQTGPKAHYAGADLVAFAASGTLSTWGDRDRPPVGMSIPQAMLHAGADAAAACMAAHWERERSGRGQHLDVSAQVSCTFLGAAHTLTGPWGDRNFERTGSGLKFGPLDLRMIYESKDGYMAGGLFFGSAIGPATRRLMGVVCAEGYCDAATRDKDWVAYTQLLLDGTEPLTELDRVQECIAAYFRAHTVAELYAVAREHDLLFSPVNTPEGLLADHQLEARGFWTRSFDSAWEAPVAYPGPIARFSGYGRAPALSAPRVGEHTAEILGVEVRPHPAGDESLRQPGAN